MSPVVIDVNGDGFELTDAENGVTFDLNHDGTAETIAWTEQGSDDSWLILDRNGNGIIDDGGELFGNFTPQPASTQTPRNGFVALAVYDKTAFGGNEDNFIDDHDLVFARLKLWQDANHNGISEPGELHSLVEVGITSISLDWKMSKRHDRFGNVFRYRAKIFGVNHKDLGRWAYDVSLLSWSANNRANIALKNILGTDFGGVLRSRLN